MEITPGQERLGYKDPLKLPKFGEDIEIGKTSGFIHATGISVRSDYDITRRNQDYLVTEHGKGGGLVATLIDTIDPAPSLIETAVGFAQEKEPNPSNFPAPFVKFSIEKERNGIKIKGFGQGDTMCFAVIKDEQGIRLENVLGRPDGNIQAKTDVEKTYPSGTIFLAMSDGALETLTRLEFLSKLTIKYGVEKPDRDTYEEYQTALREVMRSLSLSTKSLDEIDRLVTKSLKPLVSVLASRPEADTVILGFLKESPRNDDVSLLILRTVSLKEWAGMDIEELMPRTARSVLESYGNKEINNLLAEMIKKSEYGLPFMRLCAITDYWSLERDIQKWFGKRGLVIIDKEIEIDPQSFSESWKVGDSICNDLGLVAFRDYSWEDKTGKEITENIESAGGLSFFGPNMRFKHGIWASVTHTGDKRFALCGPFVVGRKGRGIMIPASSGAVYAFSRKSDLSKNSAIYFKLFTSIQSDTLMAFRAWGMYMQYPKLKNKHLQNCVVR